MEQSTAHSGRRVAIVGGASSRKDAPYDDPSWEIWAFSSLRFETPRITRWFEMHALGDLRTQLRRKRAQRYDFASYMRFLRSLRCPIYMQKAHPELPTSVAYPLDEALRRFGRLFTSTVSYLIALAIMEEVDQIGVFGVHLTQRTVYARQRPAVLYLLAQAKQNGIDVLIPPASPLKLVAKPKRIETAVLYGYDWRHPGAWWRPRTSRSTTRRRKR